MEVYDAIALAKSVWSSHQSYKIHYMLFIPKEACQIVCVIAGGDTSHHALPTIIWICLPNW